MFSLPSYFNKELLEIQLTSRTFRVNPLGAHFALPWGHVVEVYVAVACPAPIELRHG